MNLFRVLVMATAVLLCAPASAQRIGWTPVTPGNMQWGQTPSGSTTYRQNGPMNFGSDGSNYYRSGNTTISNDGGSSYDSGTTSVGSDGRVGQQVGDAYYERLSNGQMKVCRRYGDNVMCSWN